jgi:multicomponent Na+:H+ antiporter subunit C
MTLVLCILIGVLLAVSVYLMLGGELKEVCMGVFLLGHAANLTILAVSRSPTAQDAGQKLPPILLPGLPASSYVDPLPQALILTAIVIGFAVQAFLLTLLITTHRRTRTLDLRELSRQAAEGADGDSKMAVAPK